MPMLMVDLATTIHVAYLSANGELKKYCTGSIQRVTATPISYIKWPCDYGL